MGQCYTTSSRNYLDHCSLINFVSLPVTSLSHHLYQNASPTSNDSSQRMFNDSDPHDVDKLD
jgi:hypothetical protein